MDLSQPSSTSPRRELPSAWIDRLFARFLAMWGAQKVGTMWAGADVDSVKSEWGRQLAGFEPRAIGIALQDCADSGREWPPSLPEFKGMCREAARYHASQIGLLPTPKGDPVAARDGITAAERQIAAQIGHGDARDPLFWARRPKSPKAVWLLVQGAARNEPLRAILRAHIRTGGADCRTPEASATMAAIAAQPPEWIDRVAA